MVEIKNIECFFPQICKDSFEFEEDYLKSITVCFDMKGNGVFMPEFQRYSKWANTGIIMSQSTMHSMEKFMSGNFDPFTKYVTDEIKELIKKYYNEWKLVKTNLSDYCEEYKNELDNPKVKDYVFNLKNAVYESFEKLVHNLPRGLELWTTCTTNYLQLKTIVIQRFHHKNKEDWGNFVKFCYSLDKFRDLCGFNSERWNIENW